MGVILRINSCCFMLLLLMVSVSAEGDVQYYDFVVKETNFTRLCSSKTMMTVNDSFPGPTIRARKGDTIFVNVHNKAGYGLTIHWHGVKQPRNSWFDGPEYITQCSIPSGTNFTYKVILSDEEGTLWWHAHSEWTRASVHGAIVILPRQGKGYPFKKPDGEKVIVLASWYKLDDINKVVAWDLETGDDTPSSDAYTINGQPGDLCPCSSNSTYRWSVQYRKTYLLRLVNAVMNVEMFFAIAQHNLTVVGIDGSYVKAIHTSYVMISPGQTMDILVTADQSPDRYYMAVRQYDSVRSDVFDFNHVNATAILQYNGGYDNDTSSLSLPTTLPLYDDFYAAVNFTSRFRSLANDDYSIDVPTNITTRMFMVVSMNNDSWNGQYYISSSLNNFSWVNPSSVDVLMAYYKNMSGFYSTDFPDRPLSFYDFSANDWPTYTVVNTLATKVKVLDYNEEVEIVFQGTNVINASANHPMHFHGHAFYVVGSGIGNFNNETDTSNYNLMDPPKLTTVSVPKQGWVALRFRASNPGVWLWHCHYDRHLSWGMNTVFVVKNGGTPETSLREPPSYMPTCKQETSLSYTSLHSLSVTG